MAFISALSSIGLKTALNPPWCALVFGLLFFFSALSFASAVDVVGLNCINALPPPVLDFSYAPIDVLVNGVDSAKMQYLFGSPSIPLRVPATYNISFRYTNHQDQGLISSTQLELTQEALNHTLIIFGRSTAAFPVQIAHLVASQRATEAASSAFMRYFNGGISFSDTIVRANGKDLFTPTPYGQAWQGGKYLEIDLTNVPRGEIDFDLVDARYPEIQLTYDVLALANGCSYTLFASGVLGNFYSPLLIVDSTDSCSTRQPLLAAQ